MRKIERLRNFSRQQTTKQYVDNLLYLPHSHIYVFTIYDFMKSGNQPHNLRYGFKTKVLITLKFTALVYRYYILEKNYKLENFLFFQ